MERIPKQSGGRNQMCLNCIIKQIKFSQKIGNTQSVIDLTQQAKTELTRLINKNIRIDTKKEELLKQLENIDIGQVYQNYKTIRRNRK